MNNIEKRIVKLENKFNLLNLLKELDCLGMSIVNHTNEINNVSVAQRQETNDECFDFAKNRIERFILDNF